MSIYAVIVHHLAILLCRSIREAILHQLTFLSLGQYMLNYFAGQYTLELELEFLMLRSIRVTY